VTTNLTRAEARRRTDQLTLDVCEVELDLAGATDPGQAMFPTRTTLTLTTSAPDTFLDFIGESVDALDVDGQPRPIAYDGARLQLTGLPVGRPTTVTVRATARYSRSGEGLHRYVDPVDGQTYLYTHCEPSDARRYFVNIEQPDLKARYTVIVTGRADWQILANQPEEAREPAGRDAAGDELVRVRFAQTPPLSTYLLCVAAGPYRRWEDSWTGHMPDGTVLTVPLAALCRASLASTFDPERVLGLTKTGLDHFNAELQIPYPWGKYDSIFVPEYNIGAMENPGLVTFNDALTVFQSGATRSDHERRATTIMHEMSHMWFGDLVTPAWWDDLWLKESLADYLGTAATAQASEYTDAWTAFCARRKAWAHRADQLPTTHPIVADIPDVEAAKQNFDGITYAKGAAVIKQLVAYVGREAFLAGVRPYFAKHAYGSATLGDLFTELEAASGRDLQGWSEAWLQTSGVATLTPRLTLASDGTVAGLEVLQDGRDEVTGTELMRPHRITVGLYGERPGGPAGELARLAAYGLDLTGARTAVPDAIGAPAPALVVVDDEDLTYAKVRLDEAGRRVALTRLTDVSTSLTRAVLWAALWNDCRDARLSAAEYLPSVLAQARREPEVALVATALEQAVTAASQFVPDGPAREAELCRVVEAAWAAMNDRSRGADHQLAWARAFASAALGCAARAEEVRRVLAGDLVVEGLALGPQLRWQLLRGLVATGHADEADLDRERAGEATSLSPVRHLAARLSMPTAAAKAAAWQALLTEPALTNDLVSANADGFSTPGQGALRTPYVEPYFAALERIWAARSQELAQRVVKGLFPAEVPAGSGVEVPALAGDWLAAHPDAPGALRRTLIELRDDALRAERAQGAYAAGAPRA
jgi:aminopeptidase N